MRSAVFLVFAAWPSLVGAQQVVDGSDAPFKAPVATQIAEAMQSMTGAPYSIQIKGLKKSKSDPNDYCGLVNAKNQFGAYSGFQPFIMYSGVLYLQPADQCQDQ